MWRNNYSAFQKKKFSGKSFLGGLEIFFLAAFRLPLAPEKFFPGRSPISQTLW
jgi:hypothetical protein